MLSKLQAQYIQAFLGYKSADGSAGVTNLTAGIQFKNGLYVGGTFSAASLPISPDNVTINGVGGNGYIQFAAQTVQPSLAPANIYADTAGRIAFGHSGTNTYAIIIDNSLMSATRTFNAPNKSGTWALVGDNLSSFVNDSGFVVGPGSAVSGRLPSFNGTSGKLIQDSGIGIAGTSGKTLTVSNSIGLAGVDGKVLTLNQNLTLDAASTGFTLTIPATGTAVLTSRTLTEGAGLAGNTYDLSANRTLAMGTPGTLSITSTNAVSGTTHSHVITSSSNPGAAAALLSSNGSGYLQLVRLGIGGAPSQPLEVTGNVYINASPANLLMKDTSTGFQVASTGILTPQSGNSFRTTAFTSGVSGWNVSDAGNAEFNNVRVRGELAASVFKISEISATAGTFGVFYSAATLSRDFTTPSSLGGAGATSFFAKKSDAGASLLANGDIVRIKTWTGTGISDAWITVTAQDAGSYGAEVLYNGTLNSGSTSATFRAGTAVVDYGPSGTGFITLSADGTIGSSPNLTMATHAGSPWSAQTTLSRLGNLNGSYGYATDIYGLGIGQYGTASKSWLTVDQTNGFRIGNNTSTLAQWDTAGTILLGQTGAGNNNITIDSTNGLRIRNNITVVTQLDTSGNSTFGDVATNQANIYWDNTAKQLKFRGSTSGTVVQSYIDTDGSFVAGSGDVKLNALGLTIASASAFSSSKAVRWQFSGSDRAAVYGTGDATNSGVGVWSVRPAGSTTGVADLFISTPTASNTTLFRVQDNAATGSASIGSSGSGSSFSGFVVGSYLTSPTHMLDVYGTGWFQDTLTAANNIAVVKNDLPFISISNTGTGGILWSIYGTKTSNGQGAGLIFYRPSDSTGSTLMLKNAGTVQFGNYGAGTLVTDASGNITASSDEKLKIIKGDFNKGLDALRKLKPIRYRWRKDSGLDRSQEYVGFGARHTKRHIPEAIGKGKDGFHTMSDRVILATVVNAIKELDQRYASLQRT